LSDLRKLLCITYLFCLLALSSACNVIETSTLSLDAAQTEGLIYISDEVHEIERQVVTAKYRDMTTTAVFSAQMHLPVIRRLQFNEPAGVVETHVANGDHVVQGQHLITLHFSEEDFTIDRTRLVNQLAQHDRNTMFTENNLITTVNDAQANFDAAGSRDLEIMSLRLSLAQAELNMFRQTAQAARQVIMDAINEIDETMAGERLYAPFDGFITHIVRNNSTLNTRSQVVTIVDYGQFAIEVSPSGDGLNAVPNEVNRALIFRLNDVVQVRTNRNFNMGDGQPARHFEFDAIVASDPWGAGIRSSFSSILNPIDRDAFMLNVANSEIEFSQLLTQRFDVEVTFNIAPYNVTLPNEAIQVIDGAAIVVLYHDGVLNRRFVTLGVRQGGYTQVISGLDEGAKVVVMS